MLHTTHFCSLRMGLLCLFLQCFAALTAQNQAGLLNVIAVNGATSAKAGQSFRLNVTVKNTGTTASKPDSVYIGQIVNQPYNAYLEVITKKVPITAMNVGETRIFSLDFAIRTPFLVGATNPTITYTYIKSTTFIGINSNIIPPNSAYTSREYLRGFDYPIIPILPKANIDIQITASPNFKITIKNNGGEVAKNLYIKFPCVGPYACLNPTVSKGNANYLPPIDQRVTPPFRTDRYWYIPDLAVGESATAEGVITDGFFENANSFLATVSASSVEFENTSTKTASLTINNTKGKADLIITEVKAGTPTPNMGALGKEYLIKPTITIKNIGTEPVNITDNNPIIGYVKVSNNQTDAAYSVLDNFGTSFILPKQIPVGGIVTVTTDAFPVYDLSCNQKLYLNTKIYTGRITELRYDNNDLLGIPFTCPLANPPTSTGNVMLTMTADPTTYAQWGYNKITISVENKTGVNIPQANVSLGASSYEDVVFATEPSKKGIVSIGTATQYVWTLGSFPANAKHTWTFYTFAKTSGKPLTIYSYFHKVLNQAGHDATTTVVLQPKGTTTPPIPSGTKPDLSIENFKLVSPISIAQGQLGYFTFDLKNTGAPVFGDYRIGVYIYPPREPNKAMLVGSIPTGNTPIGTITNVKGDFTTIIDDNIVSGNYILAIKIDDKNIVNESNEANNEVLSTVFISPRLVITNVAGAKTVKKGEKVTFAITIKNNQNEPSRAATISLRQISIGSSYGGNCAANYTTDYIPITDEAPVPTIAPLSTSTVNISFIVNKDIVVGRKDYPSSTGYGYTTNITEPFFIFKQDAGTYGQDTPKCGVTTITKGAPTYGYEYMLRTEGAATAPPPTPTNSDLQVTITTAPAQYTQYTNQMLQITVKNNGTQTTNGIKVSFEYLLSALPYVNNQASVGAYNQITKIWDIGTMTGNQSATLKLVLFPIVKEQDLPIKATLVPNDSNPTNNTATVTLKPITITPRSPKDIVPTQATPIIAQSLFPNPTENDVFFSVQSLDEREIMFEIRDSFGKMIQREATKLTRGENQVLLHVENLPQGLYFITPITNNGRLMPLKLIKL